MAEAKAIPVRVAVRVRPLIQKEVLEGCQQSLTFPNLQQVVAGQDKAFTYDYVFPCYSKQEQLYKDAVQDRIDYLFKGYNLTVLAYGQTGSGKTYTMGTSYASGGRESYIGSDSGGIIQRAIKDIFAGIEQRSNESEFLLKVSFLEVYKEDVFDLLRKNKDAVSIREDQDGIKIIGLTEQPVTTASETYKTLELGSSSRTTASTAMNTRSSRSHAIFTISLEQRTLSDSTDFKRAKFHLVDLAGSERANKTGALGERFREGVNINMGLLALGNVISALCDDNSHIPYRDSKLTRLLQDSLGGNSHTLMIACVSPADSNLDETINTLRYADRARKIKNKPIINRDPQNAELIHLRQQVQQLQLQLMQTDSLNTVSTKSTEDVKVLLERNKHLESENTTLKSSLHSLGKKLQHSLDQTSALCEKALKAEHSKEKLVRKFEELQGKTNQTVEAMMALSENNPELVQQLQLLQEWQNKIVEIQCDQMQKDQEFSIYSPCKKTSSSSPNVSQDSESSENSDIDCDNDDEANPRLKCTLRQAAMNKELMELEKALAIKEEMACKMQESDSHMAVMRIQFESNVRQMEEEISCLQKEKEELINALKAAQASKNTNKVSEQRRKRLQELEGKISEMNLQIKEKGRLLKMKQEAERKVMQLQNEIRVMKFTRVKLVKQIREEGERYRMLKAEKDREVAQLKQKDRKRQYEMTKLKNDFDKQKTVMKRKVEEATAANKRLNEALKQQKSVAERRAKEKQHTLQEMGTRVQQWLSQEVEVLLRSKEAHHHLQILIEDRKTIVEQLNVLTKSLENTEPPKKKRSSDSSSSETESSNSETECKDQIQSFKKELELINLQIAELQQQIADAEEDEKNKHRWESMHNMVEAKCAMKWLFDTLVDSKLDTFLLTSKHSSEVENMAAKVQKAQSDQQAANHIKYQLNERLRTMKSEHNREMVKLQRENEDRTIYLMKQLNNSTISSRSEGDDTEVMQQIKIQAEEIARLGYLNEELRHKDEEIEDLRKQLTIKTYKGETPRLMKIVKKDKVCKKLDQSAMAGFLNFSSEEEDEYLKDDNVQDPDWRATPLWKQQQLSRISSFEKTKSGEGENQCKTKKLQNSATGCSCRVGCSTKRCGCSKQNKTCSELCRCVSTTCFNRADNSANGLNSTYTKTEDEDTPKAPPRSVLREINDTFDKNLSADDFKTLRPIKKDQDNKMGDIECGGLKKFKLHDRTQKYMDPLC